MDFDDRLIGRWVGDVPGRHVRTYDRPTEQNIKDCLGLILLLLLASIMYYLLVFSSSFHLSTKASGENYLFDTAEKFKERTAEARDRGDEDGAPAWEDEVELQANLRADMTQNEGKYSRFLDREDWYERVRLAHAERCNKKKKSFGNLLDGLDLE